MNSVVNEFYYSSSAAAADINHDGVADIIAGPYYYLGPDYKVARDIYLAQTRNPSTQYATTMVTFATISLVTAGPMSLPFLLVSPQRCT